MGARQPISAEETNNFAKEAMAHMARQDIAPTPDNFMVWYSYVAKKDPDICQRIDWMLQHGRIFDAEECNGLTLDV